jgi:hypothetical protein
MYGTSIVQSQVVLLSPGKKRKQIENDDEKQKKKQEYEKNHPDRKFSSK